MRCISDDSTLGGSEAMGVAPRDGVNVPSPLSGSCFWINRTDDVQCPVLQDLFEQCVPWEMGQVPDLLFGEVKVFVRVTRFGPLQDAVKDVCC